jgi:hypothetical protein
LSSSTGGDRGRRRPGCKSPRGRTVRGHDPTGSDRLLIRPAMWWARPVPAARGTSRQRHIHDGQLRVGHSRCRRQPAMPGRDQGNWDHRRGWPVTIRATLPAGTNPVRAQAGTAGSITGYEPTLPNRGQCRHVDDSGETPSGTFPAIDTHLVRNVRGTRGGCQPRMAGSPNYAAIRVPGAGVRFNRTDAIAGVEVRA